MLLIKILYVGNTIYKMNVVYLFHCVDLPAVYIGSTVNLAQRTSLHRSNYNRGHNSKFYDYVRENGDIEKWQCDVLETVDGTRKQLREREQHHITQWQSPLLNERRAVFDMEERKKYRREFYRDYYARNKEAYKIRYENRKSKAIINVNA
jgi:hypothetical protein